MWGKAVWPEESRKEAPSRSGEVRGQPLIHLRQVCKTYVTAGERFPALTDINLAVETGEFLAVVGKSGSGKSTLINMITGIDRPTSGEIFIGGVPIHKLGENKKAVWRGKTVGIVFQFFQLIPTLTILENIILPMDFCHSGEFWNRRKRALQLLELVDLVGQQNKQPTAVSGGQQQRAAIARALANDPPILIADEPTGNLDSKTSESVIGLFETLAAQGKTILIVTHDQDLARRASRKIDLADGKIVHDRRQTHRRKQAAGSTVPSHDPEKELEMQISSRITSILEDRAHAAQRLREELIHQHLQNGHGNRYYQEILNEFERRAQIAQSLGNHAEAESLWKILAEATELEGRPFEKPAN